METRQGLELHHPVLQETNVFRVTVDMIVHHLPLPGKDHVVLLDRGFNGVGRCQDLLTMFLGVGLDMTNLCRMGSPFNLGIVHLKEQSVRKIQLSFGHPPHPGFQSHYPG